MTCGSVDDGKSTLLGRLLHDADCLADDQRAALEATADMAGALDYASILDGLEAERQQGITIDVAYRYFATAKRSFIAADVPGHEQYTRNMATAASTSEAALLLIDPTKGVLAQTRRHLAILGLMRAPHLIIAITKMDLIDFDQRRFEAIAVRVREAVGQAGLPGATILPVSGRDGDNLVARSDRLAWFQGMTLLEALEHAPSGRPPQADEPFRFWVQMVQRDDAAGIRRLAGTIVSGSISNGDAVRVAARGTTARALSLHGAAGPTPSAGRGEAVSFALDQQIDVARGDLVTSTALNLAPSDQFDANVIWLSQDSLVAQRSYEMRIGTCRLSVQAKRIHGAVRLDDLQMVLADALRFNDIGSVQFTAALPISAEPYAQSPGTGAFILIDRVSGATVAAGMITQMLDPSATINRQAYAVSGAARAQIKGQKPLVLWFTGEPAAGKSTLANLVEENLFRRGLHTYTLDGDNLRLGLNRDLGFSEAGRVENIRRSGEVAHILFDAGLIVLAAFVSPHRVDRNAVRAKFEPGSFIEIHVDADLPAREARDIKGLYRKARAGQVSGLTGFDAPYEAPVNPEIHLDASRHDALALSRQVIDWLVRNGYVH